MGGLTVSQDGLHSSVYGFLHEYFVKTRDNQTIDGVKTFNKEIVVGSSNGWGRMTMPLTDGTNWVLETNPQYKSNPIGHPALRFNHNDGGTRRFYDLVKSDKNETIAYQSWVTSATVAKANHLTTARNITLTGAVTGNVNFDGSRNVSVDTVLNLAEFTNLKAENGYQRLPNGLILQWGKLTSDRYLGESTQSITFPIAFPTACLNVQANMYMAKHSPLGDGGIFVIDFNRNTAKFSLQNIGTNSVGDLRGFYWFSIGY